MSLPNKAIEEAEETAYNLGIDISDKNIRNLLEAARPFIAAQAVWDAANRINIHQFGPVAAPYLSAIKAQIKADADGIERDVR